MVYRILSLDGGGIKGLFTARVLARLETEIPFLANVDLFAGTSTGGILALGLAAGRTPSHLGDLYRNQGRKIFDDSFWDDLVDFGKAVGADYGRDNLEAILKKEFQSTKLLEDLTKKVVISTFDLHAKATSQWPEMWKPKFFHNFDKGDKDERIVDVALRTSAAPTYFPTYQGYIDGGVVANNPSMVALAQALDPTQGAGQQLADIRLLSISTGLVPRYIEGDHNWGWSQWAVPMVELMIGGMMGVADYQCRQILGPRYHRVDHTLDQRVDLDDADDATLEYLEAQAIAADIGPARTFLQQHWGP